jgi:hypothetical protein
MIDLITTSRLQRPSDLRHEMSSLVQTLGSWLHILLKAWVFFCIHSMFVLPCVSSGLAMGWSLFKGVLLTVYKIKKLKLKLNTDQLRWAVGHCFLKGHLFKWRLTNDPICERFLEEDESATHILCDCEAVAYIRFRHLGQFFMEPSDYYDAAIYKVLHFIRGVGLIKG